MSYQACLLSLGLKTYKYRLPPYTEGTSVPPQAGTSGSTAKSAADLKAEAFKYKNDNIKSIGFDPAKQAQYAQLLRTALTAEETESKNRK